ncbi:MAG: oligopeptide/dipeptide transporter, ATPase subunit [Myxococcales bacterium]|nr:oligopeptide/dipeptide transporter, ATPase subunit [Myxococcales bacterium]
MTETAATSDAPLLDIRDLVTRFATDGGELRAVDGVSFAVPAGHTVGIVGESGSGKSVTALSILRLVRAPGRVVGGQVLFRGRDLASVSEREMQRVRGAEIAMIFQEPMTSLNPVMTTGMQVAEPLMLHRGLSKKAALVEAEKLFKLVGIADPDRRIHDYPHQMSGGMRQRVMIAMALACRPALVIADEPTTALDVTIQAQILDLLARLRRELNMSLLLITHDLGVVAETCDDVVVMYAGHIVEQAPAAELFRRPRHPYTAGLLASRRPKGAGKHLQEIPGLVPRLDQLPSGCRFADRCPRVQQRCRDEAPPLAAIEPGRLVRCFFPVET